MSNQCGASHGNQLSKWRLAAGRFSCTQVMGVRGALCTRLLGIHTYFICSEDIDLNGHLIFQMKYEVNFSDEMLSYVVSCCGAGRLKFNNMGVKRTGFRRIDRQRWETPPCIPQALLAQKGTKTVIAYIYWKNISDACTHLRIRDMRSFLSVQETGNVKHSNVQDSDATKWTDESENMKP